MRKLFDILIYITTFGLCIQLSGCAQAGPYQDFEKTIKNGTAIEGYLMENPDLIENPQLIEEVQEVAQAPNNSLEERISATLLLCWMDYRIASDMEPGDYPATDAQYTLSAQAASLLLSSQEVTDPDFWNYLRRQQNWSSLVDDNKGSEHPVFLWEVMYFPNYSITDLELLLSAGLPLMEDEAIVQLAGAVLEHTWSGDDEKAQDAHDFKVFNETQGIRHTVNHILSRNPDRCYALSEALFQAGYLSADDMDGMMILYQGAVDYLETLEDKMQFLSFFRGQVLPLLEEYSPGNRNWQGPKYASFDLTVPISEEDLEGLFSGLASPGESPVCLAVVRNQHNPGLPDLYIDCNLHMNLSDGNFPDSIGTITDLLLIESTQSMRGKYMTGLTGPDRITANWQMSEIRGVASNNSFTLYRTGEAPLPLEELVIEPPRSGPIDEEAEYVYAELPGPGAILDRLGQADPAYAQE